MYFDIQSEGYKYLNVSFNISKHCKIVISYRPDEIFYSFDFFDNTRYILMVVWISQNYKGKFMDFDFHVNPPKYKERRKK